ncbi:multidrug transporter, partial [Xanthomonas oryzae pv. oryzae]
LAATAVATVPSVHCAGSMPAAANGWAL